MNSEGVAVLVPVLNRPHNALPLAVSLRATTDALLIFLCTPRDSKQIKACDRVARKYDGVIVDVVSWRAERGDYARKINHGVGRCYQPWLFQAADDLRFHSGWVEEALRVHDMTGKRVIGTNDMGNRRVRAGKHSTHSLVHRSYIEEIGTVDEPGKMLHEGYSHNFVDDELIQCAIAQREFVFAPHSRVEHLHPNWGKGRTDSTYVKGMAEFQRDRDLLRARRHLWHPRAVARR